MDGYVCLPVGRARCGHILVLHSPQNSALPLTVLHRFSALGSSLIVSRLVFNRLVFNRPFLGSSLIVSEVLSMFPNCSTVQNFAKQVVPREHLPHGGLRPREIVELPMCVVSVCVPHE